MRKKTPTWLASAFIFIDLYEKVSLASERRSIINQTYRDFNRVWQWFDERRAGPTRGCWGCHNPPNNRKFSFFSNGAENFSCALLEKTFYSH